MAQSGFTPIQLFRTTTAAAVPTAGSLADGELAINLTDEKLYFKNASGTVKLLASAGGAAGTVTSVDVSGGTTGLTFSGGPVTSSGTITMAGTLGVANGGTGASSLTSGYLLKGNGTSAVSASVIYDDGTNVGIGVTPSTWTDFTALQVGALGGAALGGLANNTILTSNAYYNSGFKYAASGAGATYYQQTSSEHRWFTAPSGTAGNAITFTERMRIDSSGSVTANVDIRAPIFYDSGNTAYYLDPTGSTSLNVAGNMLASGNLTLNNGANRYVRIGSATNYSYDLQTTGDDFQIIEAGTTPRLTIKYPNGYVGIGTSSPSYLLDVAGAFRSSGYIINNNGASLYTLFANDGGNSFINAVGAGNVGIGTSSPGYRLDVSGGALGTTAGNSLSLSRLYGTTSNTVNLQTTLTRASNGSDWTTSRIRTQAQVDSTLFGYMDFLPAGAGGALAFGNDATEFMRIAAAGNVTATVDIRAPIFYDSNDTGYYVNPNSTSNLYYLNVLAVGPNTGSYNQPDVFRIWMADPNWAYGAYSNNSTQYWMQTQFYGVGDDSRGFRVLDKNGDVVRFRVNGAGSAIASADMRAPIFYDSNDTAYYIDPTGNTVLNTLWLRTGSSQSKFAYPSNFGYSASYRTVVLGNEYLTTISMGVDVSGNASGSFNGQGEGREVIFRNGVNFITPNSANNSYLNPFSMADGYAYSTGSFRAPVFYDTDNTGYYVNPASGSNLFDLTVVGTTAFAGGSFVANNGDIYARRSGGSTGVYYFADGGSKYLYWDGGSYNFGSAGPVIAPTSFRAPIFYDSDNTAYYVDAASTSVMNQIQFPPNTAQISGNDTSSYGSIAIRGVRNGWYGIHIQGGGNAPHLMFESGNGGIYFEGLGRWASYYSAANNCWGFGTSATSSAYNIWCPTGVYSGGRVDGTIFYDSNNTNYYLDPNSGGTSIFTAGTAMFSDMFMVLRSNGIEQWATNGNAEIAVSYYGYGGGTSQPRDFAVYDGRAALRFKVYGSSNYTEATGSLRAPIFYDSGNTAYYLDPASGSKIRGLLQVEGDHYDTEIRLTALGSTLGSGVSSAMSWWVSEPNVTWNDGGFGYNVTNDGGTPNGFGRLNTSFGQAYTRYTVDGYMLFYCTNSSGTRYNVMSLYSNNTIGVDNILSASGSLRAPIFYDTNNTAYYVDPAGTSYVSGDFQVQQSSINGIRLLSTTGTQSLWIRAGYDTDGSATPVVSATNIQFQSSGSSGGSFTFVSGNTKALTITGDYAQGGANLRAPIFYDSDNTGFYIDAASTSNINQLNGNGKIVLETSDSFLRINQYNGFSNGIWMGPSNIGGSGELHLGSNGTPSTARVRVIGGTYNGSVVITLNGADGSITAAGNVTAYSDIRVKDNVETVPAALAKLSAIRGVTYTRTDLDDKERRYAGVIAQEIEQVLPEAVREINDIKTVDYNATIALLIQAVKELSAEVQLLKAKEY